MCKLKKYLNNFLFFLFLLIFSISSLTNPKPIKAQELDYQCIGDAVAEYMNTVIDIAGDLQHIRLLSPAFNMSSRYTPPIIDAMDAAGANWNGLYGISGNAYNHINTITYWVEGVMDHLSGLGVNLPVMVTETGYITGTFEEMLPELDYIRSGSHNGIAYIGAELFNAFNTNGGWSQFAFTDDELSQICGSSCGRIGVNSAAGYHQPDSFYDKARDLGMNKSLEIFTSEENTTTGVFMALDRGIEPTIRIGTAGSAGPDAVDYAHYLVSLDQQVAERGGGIVYAIAGPNEPDIECWTHPECCGYLPGAGSAYGGSPLPVPYVPCNEVRNYPEDREFHSLRPYQASPCYQYVNDIALFCGNDFLLTDTITIEKTYRSVVALGPYFTDPDYPNFSWGYTWLDEPYAQVCVPNEDGEFDDRACMRIPPYCETIETTDHPPTETTEFTVDRQIDIAIDLDGAELPIMGYTEPSQGTSDPYRVVNRVNQDIDNETMTDSEKVSEYVSWYLNGVIGRAEYDFPPYYEEDAPAKIVDFSGPLKRLLSFDSQMTARVEEIDQAGITRHDQIVGCVNDIGEPVSCYPTPSQNETRISYWSSVRRPPLRENYDDFDEYLEDFETWRSNPLNRSSLFSYIPFSSTEDRIGQVEIHEYEVQPITYANTNIICSAITNQVPSNLFFAHMQEGVELADILQQIHSPQDADLDASAMSTVTPNTYPVCDIAEIRKNPGDNLFPSELSATVEFTADIRCDFLLHGNGRLCEALPGDTECHDGDSLDEYRCDEYYDRIDCPGATDWCGLNCEFALPCTPPGGECANCWWDYDLSDWLCEPNDAPGCCPGYSCQDQWIGACFGPPPDCEKKKICAYDPEFSVEISPWEYTESCTREVLVSFQTIVKTPLANEVWAKLVAGPFSAFRRIFPQIEDAYGRPIRRLWDLPTETEVTYNVVEGNVEVVGGTTHSLYFPHIGGIHTYFLNCTQQTLRPQGYGGGCVNAPTPPPPPPPGSTEWISCPNGCNENSCPSCDCISLGFWACCVTNPGPGTWGDIRIEWKNDETGFVAGSGPTSIGPGGQLCAPGWYGDGPGGTFCHYTSNCVGCQGPCGGAIDP